MFKHRLLPARKLAGVNCLRVYGKLFVRYGSVFLSVLLLFLWLRTERLSRLKDLGDSRADELNRALKRLPVVDESRDSWRSPRVEGARILSAYLDTRPEVVLEEDSSLSRGDTAWAMIRIIAIVPVKMENSPLTCHYRYRYRDNGETRVLSRRAIGTRLAAFQENFGMSYCAAFLLCELPGRDAIGGIELPHEVTVSTRSDVDTRLIDDGEYVVVRYPTNGWRNWQRQSATNALENSDENSGIPNDLGISANNFGNSENHSRNSGKNSRNSENGLENSEKMSKNSEKNSKNSEKISKNSEKISKNSKKNSKNPEKMSKNSEKNSKNSEKNSKNSEKNSKNSEKNSKNSEKNSKNSEKISKNPEKISKNSEKISKNSQKISKNSQKISKNSEKMSKNSEKMSKNSKNSIAICVQPLHHSFDKALDMVAFVEYYRMMGVERFTFYRDTVDARVDEVLEYYARCNLATVIEWRISEFYVYERSLRVDGIFAALNDCLYRSTFHQSYRYVAGVDIDEYIVPRIHDDIPAMMDYLNSDPLVGAWIFRNMFFYLMHPDDARPLGAGLPKLKVHTKTMRWREINRPGDRSKFIVQGRDVIDMGNHRIWKLKRAWSMFGARYKEVAVDPGIAGSHHYRKCETTVETCYLRPTVLDRAAHRFTPRLAERVANVSKTIFPFDSLWP